LVKSGHALDASARPDDFAPGRSPDGGNCRTPIHAPEPSSTRPDAEQARRVAGIEAQDREIADAVAKMTSAPHRAHQRDRNKAVTDQSAASRSTSGTPEIRLALLPALMTADPQVTGVTALLRWLSGGNLAVANTTWPWPGRCCSRSCRPARACCLPSRWRSRRGSALPPDSGRNDAPQRTAEMCQSTEGDVRLVDKATGALIDSNGRQTKPVRGDNKGPSLWPSLRRRWSQRSSRFL